MKNKLQLLALLVITFCSVLIIQACARNSEFFSKRPNLENNLKNIKAKSQKIPANTPLDTWQDKLNYAIDNPLLSKQGLKLVNYKLNENINIDSLINNPINDQTLIPIYFVSDTINNNFFISTVSHAPYFSAAQYTRRKKEMIERFLKDNLAVVSLTWDYKGNFFKTQCLVSITRQHIVYDNILSNINTRGKKKQAGAIGIEDLVPIIKKFSEGGPDGEVEFNFSSEVHNLTNMWGTEVASAYCVVQVKGNRQNGIVSITSHDETGYFDSEPGYSADAQVNFVSFQTGVNGHCDYKYAVLVGESASVTIGWNGTNFTIPGGSNGVSGGKYVASSDLN